MSLLSAIKKVGRAIDPTNKSSPLGGLINSGLNVVAPGSGAILSGIGAANASKPAPPPPPPPKPASIAAPGTFLGWMGTTAGTTTGLAVAGLLALWLLVRRK